MAFERNGKRYSEALRNIVEVVEETSEVCPDRLGQDDERRVETGRVLDVEGEQNQESPPQQEVQVVVIETISKQEAEKREAERVVDRKSRSYTPEQQQQRDQERLHRIVNSDVRTLDSRELLIYFLDRFHWQHGYPYMVSWEKEHSTFKGFKARYADQAGLMVDHLFDKHSGMWDGQVVGVSYFQESYKWFQDKLYFELQREINQTQPEGLMKADDFLSMGRRLT